MENLKKLSLLTCGLIISSLAFAGGSSFSDLDTTCYVLKNNKLVKKAFCSYEGSSGGGASGYAFFNAIFHVKGYGKVKIDDEWSADMTVETENPKETVIQKINNKNAVKRGRDAKTLKILSDKEMKNRIKDYMALSEKKQGKNMPSESWLQCFATKNNSEELCYIDNTPR